MAKVSIIVPIYNVEKYLSKCLDSLINQTFKDIEIWAISDGSKDNSESIIKEYTKKDKRVKGIFKENGGYGSVLEYAIKNIKTEYFLICDPDDWLHENAIKILYNKALKYKVDLVVGGKYLVDEKDYEEVYDNSIIKNVNLNIEANKKYKKDELGKAFGLTPSPHAKLYKTCYAKTIKFPHHVSFTDFLLYSLYINECKSFMYIDRPLAYYLMDRKGNTMTDTNPRIFDYHYTVLKSVVDQSKKQKVVKYFYITMLNHFRYICSELQKVSDIAIKKEKGQKIYELLKMLQEYKHNISKESDICSSKNVWYNKLLLNKFSDKIFLKRLIK